jgi:hypothetical protein
LRDQQIQGLEHFVESCSEELRTARVEKATAEVLLKSNQAADSETIADLRAEIFHLCDINDKIRLQFSALSEIYEVLKRRLKDYETHEASPPVIKMPLPSTPAYTPRDQGIVTGALPADASDMVVTPVNQRTLEEELENLDSFDCVSEGATSYGDDVLSDCAASPRELHSQNDFQREQGFSYVDRAPPSGHRRNENDTTPFSELDKVRTVDVAGETYCYGNEDTGSNLGKTSASENLAKSLVHSPAAPLSTEAGTVHRLGYTSQSAGGGFFTASEKQDTCDVDLRMSMEPRVFRTVCGYCMNE